MYANPRPLPLPWAGRSSVKYYVKLIAGTRNKKVTVSEKGEHYPGGGVNARGDVIIRFGLTIIIESRGLCVVT